MTLVWEVAPHPDAFDRESPGNWRHHEIEPFPGGMKPGPARLVPLTSLAREGLSAEALRVAAHRGRLRAQKAADGTWRSSKNWVDQYVRARYRRDGAR